MNGDLTRADLVVRNVMVFNSYFKRFDEADVFIKNGKFLYIDRRKDNEMTADREVDGQGRYMIPGLIDIHMHVESSLVTPEAFCNFTVRNGLTTIVSEPHEIANVCGIEGVRSMIASGGNSPYDCYYAIPSNVPIMGRDFETSGGTISCEDMLELKNEEGVICLGEVMNFREIIDENDSEVARFIDRVHDEEIAYPLEGHCPALVDNELARYVYLGIRSDHCEHSVEEIRQRFENGVFIQLQDIMIRQEIIDFIIRNELYEYFSFTTDDVFPDILCERGHVDALMRKAIRLGMKPEWAIYCATYTPARRMNLLDRGVIAPGRLADFVLLDDLNELHIVNTFKKGTCIYDINDPDDEREDYSLDGKHEDTIHCRKLNREDFKVRIDGSDRTVRVRTMQISRNTNRTEEMFVEMPVRNNELIWQESGCQLAMVIERHGRDNNIAYGFVRGTLEKGAAATSYLHDSHDLLVVGNDVEDMLLAVNRVIDLSGGIVAACAGEITGEIALPIAGLLSRKSVKKTAEDFVTVRKAFDAQGYIHVNNIMNLCLLALTCVPVLKLTDRGYMNTVELKMVDLFEEIN